MNPDIPIQDRREVEFHHERSSRSCLKISFGNACVVLLICLVLGCSGGKGGSAAERELRAIALVDHTAKGEIDEAQANFDFTMGLKLSEDKLREAWISMETHSGAFQKRTWIKHGEHRGYNYVHVGLQFENGKMQAMVIFDSGDKVTGLFFQPVLEDWQMPAYVDQNSFTEQELTFGAEEWRLQGTLTLPRNVAKPPVVILVHGSGPHDRDETIGPNKPFKDLAWGLASHGVAVFRYEKRTEAHPGKMAQAKSFTMKEETVDDAVYAVEFLGQRKDIAPQSIYVLGHSQGGYCAPRIAAHARGLAGFVSLAGNSRPLEDLIIEQTEYLMGKTPGPKKDLKGIRLAADQVKKLNPKDARTRGVILGAPMSYWFDLKQYDPVKLARDFEGRILILQGGRDYQVTVKDFAGWTNGLAGRRNLSAKLFPDLNHLMMAGQGKSKPSEYQKPGHVDAQVIELVAKWATENPTPTID